MKFSRVSPSMLNEMVLGDGMLLSKFNPDRDMIEASSILAATSGGTKIEITPVIDDYSARISNMQHGVKDMLKLKYHEAKMSGKLASQSVSVLRDAIQTRCLRRNDKFLMVPSTTVKTFEVWWVGDYAQYNGQTGFLAVRFPCAYNSKGGDITGGEFEFTALKEKDKQLFEVYAKPRFVNILPLKNCVKTIRTLKMEIEDNVIHVTGYVEGGAEGSSAYYNILLGDMVPFRHPLFFATEEYKAVSEAHLERNVRVKLSADGNISYMEIKNIGDGGTFLQSAYSWLAQFGARSDVPERQNVDWLFSAMAVESDTPVPFYVPYVDTNE